MRIPTILAAAALALAGPAHAEPASPTIAWKTAGLWEVLVDRSINDGCFVIAGFERGTFLRVGLVPDTDRAYVMLANEAWQSLDQGKVYDLEMRFDGHGHWDAPALAIVQQGLPALSISLAAPEWFAEFAASRKLVVTHGGKDIARLSLKGSRAAVDELLACQEAMSGPATPPAFRVRPTEHDPFA